MCTLPSASSHCPSPTNTTLSTNYYSSDHARFLDQPPSASLLASLFFILNKMSGRRVPGIFCLVKHFTKLFKSGTEYFNSGIMVTGLVGKQITETCQNPKRVVPRRWHRRVLCSKEEISQTGTGGQLSGLNGQTGAGKFTWKSIREETQMQRSDVWAVRVEGRLGDWDSVCSVQALSRVQLCNPMDCSTPGFTVHHQLPELAQTHTHRAGDAIQPFQSLWILLLPPSIFPSIRVFSNESVIRLRWPKY